jgi:ParB/RepB/Spo0J family partition protein
MDEQKLVELADSIRSVGLQQPIVVKPIGLKEVPDALYNLAIGSYYRIVFGHRRHAAALMCGMESLSCIVRDLTRAQILLIQLTENRQREDVNPLDEARGFKELLEQEDYQVEDAIGKLAQDLGISTSQVYARLKLLDLSADATHALECGAITAAHAIELARKSPRDQYDAITWLCYHTEWKSQQQVRVGEIYRADVSVRQLRDYLRRTTQDLLTAPFELDDAELIKEAGACVKCPHFEAEDDFKENREKRTCQYRACFDRKVQAFGERTLHNLTQLHPKALKVAQAFYGNDEIPGLEDYEVVAQREPGAIPAVIVKGVSEKIGSEVWVLPKAKKSSPDDEEKARKEATKKANKYRKDLIAACVEVDQWPVFQPEDLRKLLQKFFYPSSSLPRVLGWPNCEFAKNTESYTMAQLWRLADLMMLPEACFKVGEYSSHQDPADLEALAARIGVNAAAIRAAVYDPAPKES